MWVGWKSTLGDDVDRPRPPRRRRARLAPRRPLRHLDTPGALDAGQLERLGPVQGHAWRPRHHHRPLPQRPAGRPRLGQSLKYEGNELMAQGKPSAAAKRYAIAAEWVPKWGLNVA